MENKGTETLRNSRRDSTVHQIVDAILEEIMQRRWKPGERIPTEFELAEMMNVSRNSVREAVKILDAMGILVIRRADGTYVANGFSNRMLDPLIYSLVLEQDKSKNLYELRHVIESGSISLAAENGRPEDIEKIKRTLDAYIRELQREPPNTESILAADIDFHDAIVEATHNQLLQRINTAITMVTYSVRLEALSRNVRKNDFSFLVESHQKIAERIITPSGDDISDLVGYSLSNWKETLEEIDL